MYDWALCTKKFNYSSEHMVSHTKEKPHKCLKCSAAFGLEGHLKRHIKTVHDGIQQIKKRNSQCPKCSYKCYSKLILKNHLRKHSAELPFACDLPSCGFKTKYKRSLQIHVLGVHSDERPYECQSDGCDYKGKTKALLTSHLKVHSSEKPFACKVPGCKYTCKRKDYLTEHIRRAHSDERPFKCSTCDFVTKSSASLRRHKATHLQIKRYHCQAPNCSFASHEKYSLQLHVGRHHRKKNILCPESRCPFRCATTTLLQKHMKLHKLPILNCPHRSCIYSTKTKRDLIQHISRWHENGQSSTMVGPRISNPETAGTANAIGTLYCSFTECGFQTKFPHIYDRYIVTHNEEEKRKVVCTFCFSRFRYLSQLRRHIQCHTGEKHYCCSHCEYTTADGCVLREHARRTHDIHVMPRGKEDEVTKCCTCDLNFWSHSEFMLHSMTHLKPIVVVERLRVQVI